MTQLFLRIHRRFPWVIFIIGNLLLLLPTAHSQTITVRAYGAPVNALSINDFDFLNSTTPKWLFTIDITTDKPTTPVSVVLRIRASVNLSTGETFNNAVDMLTRAFPVTGARTITNLDFGRGGTIRDSSYVVDSNAKRRFEEIALPTGTMPTGSYTFDVTGILGPVTATAYPPVVFHLSNPTTVDLLFPFDGDQNVSGLPLFQWKFDGTRSKIYIFEKLPGQGSLEDVASGVPFFSTEVAAISLQYPASGVRSLQPGKTYVWFVEGRFTAAGGNDVVLKSTLRSFSLASTPSAGATSSILDDLERSLDPKYKQLFDQIRDEGLSVSGAIRLNGAPVSSGDLLRLFNQLRIHADGIQQVTLE